MFGSPTGETDVPHGGMERWYRMCEMRPPMPCGVGYHYDTYCVGVTGWQIRFGQIPYRCPHLEYLPAT